MSERDLTLRYLWEDILACVEDGDMDGARRREVYFTAIEKMTDGDYLASFCIVDKREEARI